MLFADGGGLFFNEWYWDPIFKAIARVLIARNRWGVGEAAVLAYYDALAPVAPDDIEFTGA